MFASCTATGKTSSLDWATFLSFAKSSWMLVPSSSSGDTHPPCLDGQDLSKFRERWLTPQNRTLRKSRSDLHQGSGQIGFDWRIRAGLRSSLKDPLPLVRLPYMKIFLGFADLNTCVDVTNGLPDPIEDKVKALALNVVQYRRSGFNAVNKIRQPKSILNERPPSSCVSVALVACSFASNAKRCECTPSSLLSFFC